MYCVDDMVHSLRLYYQILLPLADDDNAALIQHMKEWKGERIEASKPCTNSEEQAYMCMEQLAPSPEGRLLTCPVSSFLYMGHILKGEKR